VRAVRVVVLDEPDHSHWNRPPAFPDASGWLVSTIDDYWKFVAMLAAGGTRDGVRVLTEATVARMTADHVTPAQRAGMEVFFPEHASWGLGMEVPASGSETTPLPCGYGWDGASLPGRKPSACLTWLLPMVTSRSLRGIQRVASYSVPSAMVTVRKYSKSASLEPAASPA